MKDVWQIRLLGGPRMEREGHSVERFRTQKAAALLAYLAYYPNRAHSREELADRFWPDDSPVAARTSLRTALASLRRQLEPPGVAAGSVLIADRTTARLAPDAIAVDVAAFEAALAAAGAASEDAERIARLSDAIERYGGELLPGFYDDWLIPERERLALAYRGALLDLASLLEAGGQVTRALDFAWRAVAVDPLDEPSHGVVMRLLAASGRPDAALRHYRDLEQSLRTHLDEEPLPATKELIRRILAAIPVDGEAVEGPEPHRSPAAISLPETSPLPPSTVTFLFTDIQGSTALYERSGEGYRAAQALHHALLRGEFRRFGGQEVNEAGDSFLVAFARARDAVACAIAAQRGLAAQNWPEAVGALKVRMAVHTGEVEWVGTTCRGLVLHHAARMLHTVHGGQIIGSEVTVGLVRQEGGDADEDARFVDLGLYRLRDVPTPLRLFQIEDPRQPPTTFPPLNAAPSASGNLPSPLTLFFGRETEIDRLCEMVGASSGAGDGTSPATFGRAARLVTLTGPGGSGKTRLAIETARRLEAAFAGAVWFVSLAELQDAHRIPSAIADALGLPRSPEADPMHQIAGAIGDRPALFVLDNFEQLVPDTLTEETLPSAEGDGAAIVRSLLERMRHAVCLVTSRRRLSIAGEREFPVMPLPIPTNDQRPTTNEVRSPLVVGHSSFIDLPSVQLFVDRARAVRPEFEVTERNAAAVAALCVRLEGIPLALELAAARVSLFTPEQILAQLSGPAYTSPLLVSQRRDAPPRHRSLGAAIQWSVDALSAELRRYFARLSVFRGGWTIEAAAAVCAEVPADNGRGMGWDGAAAIDGLQQLRDGSLILVEELPSPSSDSSLVIHPASLRFRMLETVREYAAELLSPEERSALRRRHAEFYTALAETAFPLLHGPDQALWFDRLEWEHDNFRAALSWCQSEPAAHVLGLKLAGLLNFFWTVRGHVVEGRRWLATFLAITDGSTPTPERAGALYGAARLASAQGDLDAACDLYGRSLPIWRALEDWISIARTLCQWGHVSERMGNRVAARPLYRQSLAICRELNDRGLLAHLLTRLGEDAKLQEEDERSRVLYEESLALYRELENARGIAMVLGQMADLALLRGEDERAVGLLNEHLELSRQLGDRQNTAEALGALGRLARLHGDRVAARSHLSEALSLLHGLGPQPAMAELLFCLAAVTGPGDVIGSVQDLLAEGATILREGADPQALASCLELMAEIRIAGNGASGLTAPDAIRAARLLAAAEATRVAVDATRAWHSQRRHREALLDAVVAVLGLDVFAAAWAKGRAMSRDAALNELQSALP